MDLSVLGNQKSEPFIKEKKCAALTLCGKMGSSIEEISLQLRVMDYALAVLYCCKKKKYIIKSYILHFSSDLQLPEVYASAS